MLDESTTRTHIRLQTGLASIVLVTMVLLSGIKVLTAAAVFSRPGELTWSASTNVYVARRVQNGGPIYDDCWTRPHVASWYGPLLYLPPAIIGRWIDADEHGLFMIGRWISLVSALGTVGVIVWLLRVQWSAPMAIAVAAGLMFFTADEVLQRLDLSIRADAPVCFLTLLGLAMMVRSQRPAALLGSLVVFVLAFGYKQSSIAGPAAAITWLWLTGRRPWAGLYTALTVASFGGIVALLGIASGGKYFLNTVEAIRHNTTPATMPSFLLAVIHTTIVPITVAVFALAAEWSRRRWTLSAILFAVTFVLAVASTVRDGSDLYYYMPPLAVACVLFGRQLAVWWQRRSREPAGAIALTLVLVLAAVRYVPEAGVGLVRLPHHWREFNQAAERHQQREAFFRKLADHLNGLSGPVLCQFNTIGLYCPRSVLIDTFAFTSMADVGAFDDGLIVGQLGAGQIAAVVLNPRTTPQYGSTDMFSQRWRDAMKGRYRRVQIPGLDSAHIYEPVGRDEPSRRTSRANDP